MTAVHFGGEIVPQLFNSDGTVALSGRCDFLVNKTSTTKNVFTDSTLGTSAGNSVNLDAGGRIDVWMDGVYRVRFFDTNAVLVWEIDDVNLPVPLVAPIGGTLNLIPNGSMEIDDDSDGIADGWIQALFTNGAAAIETTTVRHGKQAVKFTSIGGAGNGGGTYTSEKFIAITPDKHLIVSFAVQSSVAGVRNLVDIQWFKEDETPSATPSTNIYDDATTNPTSFTDFVSSVLVPSDARLFKLKLTGCDDTDITAGNTIFDDVLAWQPTRGAYRIRLFADTVQKVKANDTLEEVMFTFTLLANTLEQGDEIVYGCNFNAAATATVKTIRLRFDGVDLVTNDITTSPNATSFVAQATCVRDDSITAGAGRIFGTMIGANIPQTTGRLTPGLNTFTTDQVLDITGQLAVGASSELLFSSFFVDLIRKGP